MTSPEGGSASAIELAATYVSVLGETRGLARSIKAAHAAAQTYYNRNPLQLKANVDVSHIRNITVPVVAKVATGQLRRDLREINDAYVNVELRSTAAERNKFVAELKEKLKDRRILVYLTPVVDERSLRDRLSRLPEGNVRIGLTTTAAEIDRFRRELRARLAGFTIPVGMTLQGEAEMRAALDRLSRDRTVDIDARVKRSTDVDRLFSGSGLTKISGIASAAAAGIAAIGGAAGAALGAVGALGVGIAALGPAAAAAGATAAVGLSGIGDAFKALSAASESSGADGQAQAKAVAAAQEQVEAAIEGVTDAQRTLADAQKDAEDATKDIAQAYKDATDELEDYNLALADAALSEKEAELAVRKAEKALRDASPEDREEAVLRLERANLRYAESQERNRDLQEEASEAERKGVEGSDRVVSAKERAAEANRKVEDAERALAKAHEQVAKAQQAVTDAMSSGSSAQDKAAQAMAKLAPNARAFVLAVRDLAPLWNNLVGDPTQDAMFAGAAAGIRDLAEKALPVLGAGMVDVAGSMNGLAHQFAEFWKSPENLEGIRAAFAGTASFIDGLGPGLKQATSGFLALPQAFEPVATKVGAQFAGMLGLIGQSFSEAFESGALTKLISTFGDILGGLGEGLNAILDGLIQMGNIVGPTLGPLFKVLGESIGSLAPSMGELGRTFVDTLIGVLPHLAKFVDALARGLEPVLPVVGDLLRSLSAALTPLIEPMSRIAQVVGEALVQAIDALAPAIGPLGSAFASLIAAVAPIVPVLAQVISAIVGALAPALETIFVALAPVIQSMADAFLPIIQQMQPILAETAQIIGDALAGALQQLAPILPQLVEAWGGLVVAIAPMLPQLVQLAADLLPPLIDLLVEIAPIVLKMIEAFTWLVSNVIEPLVIPAVRSMTDYFKAGLETTVAVVRFAKEKIGAGLETLGAVFTGFGELVANVWKNVVIRNIARGVKIIGDLLGKIPDWVPGSEGARNLGNSLTEWAVAHMATGGLLRGKGSGTSDSILLAASNGEYIVNAKQTSANLPLLEAINSGWTPTAAQMHTLFPGFASGGLVDAQNWARGQAGKPYQYGGVGNPSWDCSGFMGGIYAILTGKNPKKRYFTTESDFSALGFKSGLGGKTDFSIGVMRGGGGPNSHMAGTLGDLNVESSSDGVEVGAGASPASSFPLKWHLPILGNPTNTGTAPASPGTGGGLPNLGTGGTGGSGGGSGGSGGSGGGGTNSAAATNVFVTNWPASLSTTGITSAGPSTTNPTATDPSAPTQFGPTTPTTPASPSTPLSTDQGTHPLANLPIPGAAELFNGPAPWYLAASPEQAAANLGTQAASLAQRTGSDVMSFFQDNWREMLETGAGVLGMGAVAGGGTVNNWNISGTDPMSAASAVERVIRRRTLATQRSGGFGR